MELIDQFHKPGTIDCYTFVFNEQDPTTGYYTMLAMDENNMFSQFTEGVYDPDGDNSHLGERITLQGLSRVILTRLFQRLSIPDQYGREE